MNYQVICYYRGYRVIFHAIKTAADALRQMDQRMWYHFHNSSGCLSNLRQDVHQEPSYRLPQGLYVYWAH